MFRCIHLFPAAVPLPQPFPFLFLSRHVCYSGFVFPFMRRDDDVMRTLNLQWLLAVGLLFLSVQSISSIDRSIVGSGGRRIFFCVLIDKNFHML